MTLREFIKTNAKEIDRVIKKSVPGARMSYEERRLWVLNVEDLYHWARREGVRI